MPGPDDRARRAIHGQDAPGQRMTDEMDQTRRRLDAPDGHGANCPVAIVQLLRSWLSAASLAVLPLAQAAAGSAAAIVCRMPAERRVAYRQAYAYLAGVITEYDHADEMSGADLYDFIGQWMVANKIPIFNITGYDASGQPVYQQDQETYSGPGHDQKEDA